MDHSEADGAGAEGGQSAQGGAVDGGFGLQLPHAERRYPACTGAAQAVREAATNRRAVLLCRHDSICWLCLRCSTALLCCS